MLKLFSATMSGPKVSNIIEKFNDFTQKPVKYLTVQTDVKEDIKNFVKSLYDYTKAEETKSKSSALPELIVTDLDEEQIWQEIELQNSECWDRLVSDVASCINVKNVLKFPLKDTIETEEPGKEIAEDSDQDMTDNIVEDGDIDKEMMAQSEEDDVEVSAKRKYKEKKGRVSVVDDDFFKLSEMEQFLLKEEKNEMNSPKHGSDSEESIDMFEDDDYDEEMEDDNDDGDKNNVMYSDFFEANNDDEQHVKSKPKKKSVRFLEEQPNSADEDDDDDESVISEEQSNKNHEKVSEKKSEFELRQQRLKQQIEKLESKSLKDKPWQLKGEVDATSRPQNSLLQEVVDFDLTSRPAPIITEQTTYTLEDIIRRRVKDKAWDDVVRKEKPVDNALAFRKPEILDHAKSKLSLAQIYEAEYLKQKHSEEAQDENPQEPESHVQIREAMSKLFAKLDALCHYHYTPKPTQPEVKIVSNIPAINMEEVAPIAMSQAALLAPEEVKFKRRGELISKEERTSTDKKRERRKKKKLQKAKGVEKKDIKHNKGAQVTSDTIPLKTSKAFFQHLHENVGTVGKNKFNKATNK